MIGQIKSKSDIVSATTMISFLILAIVFVIPIIYKVFFGVEDVL